MENDEMVFPFLRKGKNKPYFCVVIFLQSLIPVSRNKKKADDRTRTDNLLITNQLLCQLSHIGVFCFYMLHRSIGRAQASLVCSPLIDKVNKPELSHIGVFSFYIAFCVPLENFIFPLAR